MARYWHGLTTSALCTGMSSSVSFHPQRVFPAYARFTAFASRFPGGLAFASRTLAPLMFNSDVADTENVDVSLLDAGMPVVCAFPRSGSTFLQAAVGARLDGFLVPKSHDVLAIPSYAAAGALTLVPVRRPDANAASWSMYNADEPSLSLLRSRLATYTAWHRQLLRVAELPGVHLLDFDALTSGSDRLLDALGLPSRVYAGPAAAGIDAYAHQESMSVNQRHLPSLDRQRAARHYRGLLDHPSVFAARSRAQAVYDRLVPLLAS